MSAMRIRLPAISCVLLSGIYLASNASAQTSWWRTYGGLEDDGGMSVQQTADGGYIVAGTTFSFGTEGGDVYLVKTDAQGDTLWTRTYGGAVLDIGNSVQLTADGGYIATGWTGSFDVRDREIYLVRTNAQGDKLWTGTYGGTYDDYGFSVQQTTDSGYVIAGVTTSFENGQQACLIKTNASGDTLWTRTYGGTRDDGGNCVQQTTDGGYIVTGVTRSFGAVNCDVYLVRTNSQGDTLWTRTYGGAAYGEGYSVQQTTDGGYIIAGYFDSSGAVDEADIWLIKTNAQGDTLWTRTYGGTYEDYGRSVQQTTDGGYIIAGYTHSFGPGIPDYSNAYLIKTNAHGDTLWTRIYGGTKGEDCGSAQQTADGGYILAGYTDSYGAGSGDIYLIKTDSLGNVGVAEESPRAQVPGRKPATVLSGASGVRRLASCVAFDAMGRRVLQPKPGIYFPKARTDVVPRKVLLVE